MKKKDERDENIRIWCCKFDDPSTCFCLCCSTLISYCSEGLKLNDLATDVHRKACESVKGSQILQRLYPGGSEALEYYVRTVDLATRKIGAEPLVKSAIAEH